MKKNLLVLFLAVSLLFITDVKVAESDPETICPALPDQPELLSHAKEVWISALEWCESRAKPEAVNLVDRDGTASYYCLQFKPETFRTLGEAYGVIAKGQSDIALMSLMKDCQLQRAIVRGMIKDKTTDSPQQFPVCVLDKIGYPPAY